MIKFGKMVKSDSNRTYRVEDPIAEGGQGIAYWATETRSGERGVVKEFLPQFANQQTRVRVQQLVNLRLHALCPALHAPTDAIIKAKLVGHYTPKAPGISFEKFLENPVMTFIEALQLAAALAGAVAILHRQGVAHGDLHAENLLIHRNGTVLEASLIDFDNYNLPGLPGPPSVGHNLYMAPELRLAAARRKALAPDLLTDRYSLGVLLHEAVLLKHVAAGADSDEAQFQRAMCHGLWIQDPAAAGRPTATGGYPPEVLNADLMRLFRCSLSLNRAERPDAEEWQRELRKAVNNVYACPSCGCCVVIDASKTTCPLCHKGFPVLKLAVSAGHEIALDKTVVVGRGDVGGSEKVSTRHAIFRRIGPETWMESLGTNGSYRWSGSKWVPFPKHQPWLIQSGDRLRLANVEVGVS